MSKKFDGILSELELDRAPPMLAAAIRNGRRNGAHVKLMVDVGRDRLAVLVTADRRFLCDALRDIAAPLMAQDPPLVRRERSKK